MQTFIQHTYIYTCFHIVRTFAGASPTSFASAWNCADCTQGKAVEPECKRHRCVALFAQRNARVAASPRRPISERQFFCGVRCTCLAVMRLYLPGCTQQRRHNITIANWKTRMRPNNGRAFVCASDSLTSRLTSICFHAHLNASYTLTGRGFSIRHGMACKSTARWARCVRLSTLTCMCSIWHSGSWRKSAPKLNVSS